VLFRSTFGKADTYVVFLESRSGKLTDSGKIGSSDFTATSLLPTMPYKWYVVELASGARLPVKDFYYFDTK